MSSEEVCLICLKQTQKMMNIHENDEESTTVFKLLTGITITTNDSLCRPCYNLLQIVVDFREKCLTSDLCLIREQTAHQPTIKEEEELDITREWVEESSVIQITEPLESKMSHIQCSFCPQIYSSSEELEEHEASHYMVNTRELSVKEDMNGERFQFPNPTSLESFDDRKCNLCGQK